MPRKKIDNRIRTLIENGVATGHRSMFILVGEKAKDQVVYLHHMLSKTVVKSRPTVLWCYKKELGFSSHRKKKIKSVEKKLKLGKMSVNEDDPFELFISSTDIRYCYYKESHKILGNTYGMCVLQDFEALCPNLLARTIETVEGGGVIAILLQSVNSIKQIVSMSMDIHYRFQSEAHQDAACRFNERFLISLSGCPQSLILDDQLNVLPLLKHARNIEPITKTILTEDSSELNALKEKLRDVEKLPPILNCCKTLDQAKAFLKLVSATSEKTLRNTVSLTAARGRGKSATMGLAIAFAITMGYSDIYVTSPSPSNLTTFFEFVYKGLDALNYKENSDYFLKQSLNPEFKKAIIRVDVQTTVRQTIQFIHPSDTHKLDKAELLVIDEAAAIPLPLLKKMFGPYLIFLATTVNGYEGTGRSLTLKLLKELRIQAKGSNSQEKSKGEVGIPGRVLEELTLEESIRYKPGDGVEKWLTKLLCLDAKLPNTFGFPAPETCELLYINRDVLFSCHKAAEKFLQELVSVSVASNYANSPNDLQMMSDAPGHHLFCLVPPVTENKVPNILVFIHVCLEGQLSNESIEAGRKAGGDLIPWTISYQFGDKNFPALRGARIVRIATHPEYQRMGYGSKALELLKEYYTKKGEDIDMDDSDDEMRAMNDSKRRKKDSKMLKSEKKRKREEEMNESEEIMEPRAELPPLFMKLLERRAETLDYIGVSFEATEQLVKFWEKEKFVPVYLNQKANDITGEHTCIMLNRLNVQDNQTCWLQSYWITFRQGFVQLLPLIYQEYSSSFALEILENEAMEIPANTLSRDALEVYLNLGDIKRLYDYSKNMSDYQLIRRYIPSLARMYFRKQLGIINLSKDQKNCSLQLSAVQATILLGLGLQCKSMEKLENELNLQSSQLLGLFNKTIKKLSVYLNSFIEQHTEI